MTRKGNLAVVDAAAPAPPPRPRRKSVSAAARSGDRLELLKALRDTIAGDITKGVPPRDLASLSRRLVELSKEIEALNDDFESDPVSNAADEDDEPWIAE